MTKHNFVEIEISDGESVTKDTLTRDEVIRLFACKIHTVGVETWLTTFLTGYRVLDDNGLPVKVTKD